MTAATDADLQSLRHLHALRNFIGNLVEQADKSGGCECHKPPSLLLVGPPGAGKTYLVKQMSKVCEMPLYGVHTHQVANADSIKKLFTQARDNYPSLVFLDDVENIFANHDRDRSCPPNIQHIREEIFMELGPRKLKIHDPQSEHNPTQQLVQDSPTSGGSRSSSRSSSLSRPRPSAPELNDSYDESLYPDNNGIIVVAATNKPWQLYKDHELLSRFRGVYLVGLPDKPSRYTLLQALLRELHHTLTDDDIMDIAERTQGFTPADLMVVMKTLTYKQFSVLFNMANGEGGSHGNSTNASPTPTSSELTETGSDTDIDGLSEPKGKLRHPDAAAGEAASVSTTAAALAAVAAASTLAATHNGPASRDGAKPPPNTVPPMASPKAGGSGGSSPLAGGEGLLSRVAAAGVTVAAAGAVAATVAALQGDWTSDSEEEGGLVTQRERVPESGRDSVSADSGLVLSRSSEEVMARLGQHEHAASADDRPVADGYSGSTGRFYPSPDGSTLPVKEPQDDHLFKQSASSHDSEDPESNTNFVNEKMVDVARVSVDDERQNSAPSLSAAPGNDAMNSSGADQLSDSTLKDEQEASSANAGQHPSPIIGSSNGQDASRTSPSPSAAEQQREGFLSDTPPTAPIPVSCSDPPYEDHSPPSHFSPQTIPAQFDQVDNDRSIYDNVTRTDDCNVPAGLNGDNGDDTFNNDDEDDDDDDDENSLEDDEMHDYVLQDGDAVDATGCSETEEIVVHPECKDAPSANDTIEESDCEEQEAGKQDVGVSNGPAAGDDRVVELHYSEPPEPMRDDNLAVDSDSDNESPVLRPRRVGFASRSVAIDSMSGESGGGVNNNNNSVGGGDRNIGFGGGRPSAMSPLSVDCGGSDLPPNISLDVMGGGAALNNGGGGSDNILRQLLARPAMVNNNGGSSPGCSPTPPASPAPSHCSSGAATLASSGSGRGTPQHMLHHHQDLHHSPLHQSPTLHHHHKQQRGGPVHHSPLHHQQQSDDGGDLSDHLHHQSASSGGGNSVHLSPLHPNMGGGGSVHHSPLHHQPMVQDGRSREQRPRQQSPGAGLLQQGSPDGRRRRHASGGDDKQNGHLQKDPSDESESVSVKGVSGLGAAAAAAAATIVAAGDSGPAMSKVTEHDMEKLLSALEEHMDGTLPRAGTSNGDTSDGVTTDDEDTTTDEEEEDDEDDENKALGEIDVAGIQPITMDDVIEVLEKGYRSVSDEEIKKYTDFMVWFASVAKSACPHNNGNRSEAPTVDEDDFCVESTLCATPSLLKRNQRRRPLKKLGKFLLKALMFILD